MLTLELIEVQEQHNLEINILGIDLLLIELELAQCVLRHRLDLVVLAHPVQALADQVVRDLQAVPLLGLVVQDPQGRPDLVLVLAVVAVDHQVVEVNL
jgi:hypothetical protein